MKYLIVVQEDTYGGLHGIQDAAIMEIAENIADGTRENILRETAIDMFYGLIDSYALDMDDEYAEIDESDYIEHAEWEIYKINSNKDIKTLEKELDQYGEECFIEEYDCEKEE